MASAPAMRCSAGSAMKSNKKSKGSSGLGGMFSGLFSGFGGGSAM